MDKQSYLRKLASSNDPHSVFTGIACAIIEGPLRDEQKLKRMETLVEALEEYRNVLYPKSTTNL